MIIGFIVERVEDLEAVETGVTRFIGQFGSALSMDQPSVEPEPAAEQAEPKTLDGTLTDGKDEVALEPTTEGGESKSVHAKILRKLLPEGITTEQDIEEIVARIPNRRIRQMVQSELDR